SLRVIGRALADLGSRRVVEGEVLRARIKKARLSFQEDPPKRYWVAVYTGTEDTVEAWRVDADLYPSFLQGRVVRLEVTPHLGHVRLMKDA
ncbi:MAG: hypothetical protein M3273_08320, partial [Actinomycetota bacterium]|nr:hypothetical protein [Actinomycetota bacterium]